MELTVGGVIACGISWSKLEKKWNLQRWSTKNLHILWFLLIVLGVFKHDITHFYGSTLAMTFEFSRISKTNLETSVEYLQRLFLNHPAYFPLEQTIDRQTDLLLWVLRYPAHCTDMELLPESPQNKICYRLHPKNTPFSCLLMPFLISWRKMTECYSKLLPTNSRCRLFSCTFHESINTDVSKNVYVILCKLWYVAKI